MIIKRIRSNRRVGKKPVGAGERKSKRLTRIASIIVVTLVVAALILPAIAMDSKEELAPTAVRETPEVWEKSVSGVKLSGNSGKDLIEIAKTQLGYREKQVKSTADEAQDTVSYNRYSDWYDVSYDDWNILFAGFCINYAKIDNYPFDEYCDKWEEKLEQAKLYYDSADITPEQGDIVFADTNRDGCADCVGIISDVVLKDSGDVLLVSAITGVPGSGVKYVDYSADSGEIIGYGVTKEHRKNILGESETVLVAVTDTDIQFTISSEQSLVSENEESLTLSVSEITAIALDKSVAETLSKIKASAVYSGMKNPRIRVFDVKLLSSDKPFALSKEVTITLSGLEEFISGAVFAEDGDVITLMTVEEDGSARTLQVKTDKLGRIFALTDEARKSTSDSAMKKSPKRAKDLGAVGADSTTSLTVTKEWSDGQAKHSGDSVTLRLLKNGVPTGDVAVVNSGNNWSYSFKQLPKPESGESFGYSVTESNTKSGYISEYSEVEKTEAAQKRIIWVPVSGYTLQNDKQYALYSNGFVLYRHEDKYVAISHNQLGKVTVDGQQYSNYLMNIGSFGRWDTTSTASGMMLSCNGYYMRALQTLSPYVEGAGNVSINQNILSVTGDNGTYRFNIDAYGEVTVSQNIAGTNFQLYEMKEIYVDDDEYRQTITNRKISDVPEELLADLVLSKQIDFLGDGDTNPHTDVTGDNLYRLYLNATGYSRPVDLLIVVDASSSMTIRDFDNNMSRIGIEDLLINGTITNGMDSNSSAQRPFAEREKDGIIARFLGSNVDNMVALTAFCGGLDNIGEKYEDLKDRFNPINRTWSSLTDIENGGANGKDFYTSCTIAEWNSGTNYEAAFMRASELLENPAVKNNGHKKHLLFLTDGLPNICVDDKGTIQYNWQGRTVQAATNLKNAYPDIDYSIIGISSEATTGEAYTQLTNIARIWEAPYYLANDVKTFKQALASTLQSVSNVAIADELSKYVDYYADQPDLLVTMTNEFGVEIVVWRGDRETSNNYTGDGTQIVNNVQFISGGKSNKGKICLDLNPSFRVNGNYKFEISFNVKVSREAEEEYIKRDYAHTGDPDTDYDSNTTSSGKRGFYSNDNAYAKFNISGSEFLKTYPDPVVQVVPVELQINLKKVDNYDEHPLKGARFDLYRKASANDDDIMLIPGTDGIMGIKVNTEELISDDSGWLNVQKLLRGDYYLVETVAPPGYDLPSEIVSFTLEESGLTLCSGAVMDAGQQLIIISNETYYELPHTGGFGTTAYVILGVLLLSGVPIIYILGKRGGFIK